MEYQEQVEIDFYETYASFLSHAGLNGATVSLIMEPIRMWFEFGHKAGVDLAANGVRQYIALLKKYGNHNSGCPQYKTFPAECTCGWEQTLRALNQP
jgi:hypothetical protein